ncbi:MAG TPA: diacylglycerol kinase family protein [Mycobacteriales bacterium]|nr:diacylglycerol kinase family protein [Mycobacteriales bacterium]
MSGFLLITNAAAGNAKRVDEAVSVLRERADVEIVPTRSPADCDAAVARRGDRRVVVCGGDGSVHVVVTALHRVGGLEQPIGLIPLGTGNDLARTLQLPLNPAAAARTVLDGMPRRLDLLVDDAGDLVVNAVHLGIGAEAARRAAALKPRLGRLAYLVGGVAAGVTTSGWRLSVRVDGAELVDGQVLQVGIGLGQSIGGGSPRTPHSVLDDRLADVVVSQAVSPLARVGYGLRLRRGSHVDRPDVLTARGAEIEAVGEPFHYNADGEIRGPVERRTWTIDPRGWQLITPY